MADFQAKDVLRHSILDRLGSTGARNGSDIRISFHDLLQAVRRDIEWLLNTKRLQFSDLEKYPETEKSILNYGLPDFSHFSGSSSGDCQQICKLIVQTLQRFEPRLSPSTIQVEHIVEGKKLNTLSRFRIHGLLHVDPVKEAVVFDTEIEMDSGSVQIKTG